MFLAKLWTWTDHWTYWRKIYRLVLTRLRILTVKFFFLLPSSSTKWDSNSLRQRQGKKFTSHTLGVFLAKLWTWTDHWTYWRKIYRLVLTRLRILTVKFFFLLPSSSTKWDSNSLRQGQGKKFTIKPHARSVLSQIMNMNRSLNLLAKNL